MMYGSNKSAGSTPNKQRSKSSSRYPGVSVTQKKSSLLSAQSMRECRGRQGNKKTRRRFFQSMRRRADSREQLSVTKSSNNSNLDSNFSNELSLDSTLPGILKIFGDAISPGAQYKSVMATRQSNAKELVKIALERYKLPRSEFKNYVLCEIVGRERDDNVHKPSKAFYK